MADITALIGREALVRKVPVRRVQEAGSKDGRIESREGRPEWFELRNTGMDRSYEACL
jgi:hypothetical protein